MKHVYPAAIRFDDLDSFGHVNNVVLLEYLQEARIDFAHQYMYSAASRHEGSVVAYQSIDYLAPVGPRPEPLQVHLWASRIGSSSFDIAYEICDDDTLFARALTTLVAYDIDAGQTRPLTPGERAALEKYAEPE
ncbi:MAG TPA: thioesterase family protein [Jiangellaceae bacterium]|nr:thioesterase family protein [Jiangellaceae bacterium]